MTEHLVSQANPSFFLGHWYYMYHRLYFDLNRIYHRWEASTLFQLPVLREHHWCAHDHPPRSHLQQLILFITPTTYLPQSHQYLKNTSLLWNKSRRAFCCAAFSILSSSCCLLVRLHYLHMFVMQWCIVLAAFTFPFPCATNTYFSFRGRCIITTDSELYAITIHCWYRLQLYAHSHDKTVIFIYM